MSIFSISGIRISGLAACVPQNRERTADYDWMPEKERKMFEKTVGISQRSVGLANHTTSDWCYAAADQLLNDLQWNRNEVDLLVFISQSPDYFLPATGIILQGKLGLPNTCMAFDINLGCSGYVYGLATVAGMMRETGMKKALLLVGDKTTTSVAYKDKSTYPLFGDAGTATALVLDDAAPEMVFNLQTDGSRYTALIVPEDATRTPRNENTYVETEVAPGIIRHQRNLALDGVSVFNFSINEVPINIADTMAAAHKTEADYDYMVLHQANKLMTEQIRKKLKFPPEKVPYSINDFGNTSSASVPLTIVHKLREAITTGKHQMLLSGFGVGLSWGTVSMALDTVVCPPLLEIS